MKILSAKNLVTAASFALVLYMGVLQLQVVHKIGNKLSPIADPFSESDAIRSGRGYVDLGFWRYAGLPDVRYGGYFPNSGMIYFSRRKGMTRKEIMAKPHVYTHYPPGPNALVALYTKVFGWDNIRLYRIVPILFGVACLLAMAALLVRTLGPPRTLLLLFMINAVPMSTNMMHGLHYQGYAMSLLFLQTGVLVYGFHRGLTRAIVRWIFFIGLAQGYLSFDFFFLVVLAAVPLGVLYGAGLGQGAARAVLKLCAAAAAGFMTAHVIHLAQVIAYYRSFGRAIGDLLAAADHHYGLAGFWERWQTLWNYFFFYGPRRYYFNFEVAYFIVLVLLSPMIYETALWAFRNEAARAAARPGRVLLRWKNNLRAMAAVVLSLGVGCLWIFVMNAHGSFHVNFIPRHLMLIYLVGCLALLNLNRYGGEKGRTGP